MICYILLFISLLILFYYYKHRIKKKEYFKSDNNETCYKDISNILSDGNKTFFTNEMLNNKLDHKSQLEKIIHHNKNETNDELSKLNNSIKSSTKKYNQHNNLNNKYKNDLIGVFNEINRNLDNSKSLIDARKMDVDYNLTQIQNKANSMVGSVKSSGIQNKLTSIINPEIDQQLIEKSNKAAEDYNIGAKMTNRINQDNSKIYEWQIIDGHSSPFRINAETGEVECLSYDGINCEWNYKNKYGNNMTNIKTDEVKSLQCGEDVKRKHGITGYDNTDNWCSIAYHYFAKMGEDNIDYNSCPKDWSLIDQKTNTCIAPFDYKSPINKITYVRGRYVRITVNNREISDNWLALAEVEVISNNRNIALNKPTSSSGNYLGSTNSKANDGNNDGNWHNGSLYHSGVDGTWHNDGGPQFWQVDLGDSPQIIDRINIYNRTDCCGSRLNNWLLSIYDKNKNLIWARIYKDPPNPKVTIDIKLSDNDMNNNRIKDYKPFMNNLNFDSSLIIGSDKSWQNNITNWLGDIKRTVKLLYRATRDGFNPQQFHTLCDNKGPTITLVRDDKGRCFGGYTSLSWQSEFMWKNDDTAFMFSFNRNKKIMTKNPSKSIYHNPGNGPTFGEGHDLLLLSGGNNNKTTGSTFSDDNLNITGDFHTSAWFKPQEIEVWSYIEKEKSIVINDDRCKSRECVSLSVLQNNREKQEWSYDHNARFPFKINVAGITEKQKNVSKKTNKEIDLLIGDTNKSKNNLKEFKFYDNGIVIKTYKTSNNFLKGESYNQEFLGANINFNWGGDIIMSLPGIKDYVYLELIGYIKVPAKKVIFRLGSDDHSRLYISNNGSENNMVKVIDSWRIQAYTTVESDVLEVSKDAYIPFKIDFIEATGLARLTLEWALDDNAVKGTNKYEIISNEYFYYNKLNNDGCERTAAPGPEVFAVGPNYNYTKEQAKQVCSKYNAEVATTAQLEEAQKQGADWCFTAWVSDSNISMYPITTSTVPGCGNGRTGIMHYTPGIAGVNCYGLKPGINDYPNTILPFNPTVWSQKSDNLKPLKSGLFTEQISRVLAKKWRQISNNSYVIAITQLLDGTIVGVGSDNRIMTKKSLDDNWEGPIINPKQPAAALKSITQLNDGSILGIGMGDTLWTQKNLYSNWEGPLPNSCCVTNITQLKDGTILGVGGNNLYTKKNLNDNWQGPIPNSCCVISVRQLNDGSFIFVGKDHNLYTKKNLNDNFQGPIPGSCCIKDIHQLNDGTLLGVGTDHNLYIKD